MPTKRVHLIANAHLDPVWLWPWEDGLTEALSTFRVAAEFCDEQPDFVFNHNEALLYRWVEQYEPALFTRIQRLVANGRWHIAGGAWLQPDVNGPSGESHIRHYLIGQGYFAKHFNKQPTTAYNFDPFGHPEGLVQILAGCGVDSYIFCRPDYGTYALPVGTFTWSDRSASSILARRSDDHYQGMPPIQGMIDRFVKHYADEPETMLLWGVGNHGGGVSRREYADLTQALTAHPDIEFVHSTPEAFFAAIRQHQSDFPAVHGEIQNSFPGCHTSMARLKRRHRAVEHLLLAVERQAAINWWLGHTEYPSDTLAVAWRDVLFAQFHDVLPGSGIEAVEHDSLRLLHHAEEGLRRERVRQLLPTLADQPRAADGAVPLFVHNPHPFRVRGQTEVEVQISNSGVRYGTPIVRVVSKGRPVAVQRIAAAHLTGADFRLKLVLPVDIPALGCQRFDISHRQRRSPQPPPAPRPLPRGWSWSAKGCELEISPKTGLIQRLSYRGKDLLGPGAMAPVVFDDLDHSWTCGDPTHTKPDPDTGIIWSTAPGWQSPSARMRLATKAETEALSPAARGARAAERPAPLRIIESGKLLTVIEAVFVHERSHLIRHYRLGSDGSIAVEDRLFGVGPDRMLKLALPLAFAAAGCRAETCHSAVWRQADEAILDRANQRWLSIAGSDRHLGVVNNGSFGHAHVDGCVYLNVCRTPPYAAFGLRRDRTEHVGRHIPRMDQGEHRYRFELLPGRRFTEASLAEAAAVCNAPVFGQVYYPIAGGNGARLEASNQALSVSGKDIELVACKRSEDGEALVVRVLNHASRARQVAIHLTGLTAPIAATIAGYRLQTWRITRDGSVTAVNLVERSTP